MAEHALFAGAAVLLVCLPGIAAGQDFGGATPVERECALVDEPEALPPLSALSDSATLMSSLSRLHPDVLALRYGVYSVRFDGSGAVQWIAQLTTNVPEKYQDTVSVTLSRHLIDREGGGEGGVRLALTLGPESELVVGPPMLCPPVELERRRRNRVETRVMDMGDLRDVRRAGRARVRVLVGPRGQVLRATLLRSSGSSIKDGWALDAVEENDYAPALQDGVPVQGMLVVEWGEQ